MLTENGGEAAHQLYLNVVRKCEAMKEEYDNLHKRYADLVASHSATVSKLEVTQEELSCWRKRYEDLAHERNAAMHERNGLQQQCTAAIRQWDNALRERNEAREQLAKVCMNKYCVLFPANDLKYFFYYLLRYYSVMV